MKAASVTTGWPTSAWRSTVRSTLEYRKIKGLLVAEHKQCQNRRHVGKSNLRSLSWKHRSSKAREHWDKCKELEPNWSTARMVEILRLWNFEESYIEGYMQGIGKAGVVLES